MIVLNTQSCAGRAACWQFLTENILWDSAVTRRLCAPVHRSPHPHDDHDNLVFTSLIITTVVISEHVAPDAAAVV